MVVPLASKLVTRAQLQQRLVVEDIEPHEGGDADAVETHRVAGDRGVEPSDSARAARDGAELMAALPDLVPDLVQQLGGKRAVADARRVRLENTDREVDFRRGDAAPGEGASGSRIGAG